MQGRVSWLAQDGWHTEWQSAQRSAFLQKPMVLPQGAQMMFGLKIFLGCSCPCGRLSRRVRSSLIFLQLADRSRRRRFSMVSGGTAADERRLGEEVTYFAYVLFDGVFAQVTQFSEWRSSLWVLLLSAVPLLC